MDKKDVPMSQQESIAPRQASRFVTAEMRRAMAGERARMLGLRRPSPSVLEAAAVRWQREQEARKRAEQGRPMASRQAKMIPFSLQQVALRAEDLPPADEAFWKLYIPPQPQHKRATHQGRIGGIAVGSLGTRMIQRERAGGGRMALDPRAWALEAAARRWAEQRTRRDIGR